MRLGTRFLTFACLLVLLMAGLGFAGSAAVAGEWEKWTAEDYRTRAVDHTFYTGGGKGDEKWRALYYFRPDGWILFVAWGKGWKWRAKGTWEIKGDKMCSEYDREELGVGCYENFDKGDRLMSLGVSGTNKGKKYPTRLVGKGNVRNLK